MCLTRDDVCDSLRRSDTIPLGVSEMEVSEPMERVKFCLLRGESGLLVLFCALCLSNSDCCACWMLVINSDMLTLSVDVVVVDVVVVAVEVFEWPRRANALSSSSFSLVTFIATRTAASCLYRARESSFLERSKSAFNWKISSARESHASWKHCSIVGMDVWLTIWSAVVVVAGIVGFIGIISSMDIGDFETGSMEYELTYVVSARLSKTACDFSESTGVAVGVLEMLQMNMQKTL